MKAQISLDKKAKALEDEERERRKEASELRKEAGEQRDREEAKEQRQAFQSLSDDQKKMHMIQKMNDE